MFFRIHRVKEEIIGCNDTELLPHNLAIALKDSDQRIMQMGQGQVVEEQVLQDGSIHTYLSTKDPYRDAQGNIIGIIGIARDITERKQTLEALSRLNQRLETLGQIDRAILNAIKFVAPGVQPSVRIWTQNRDLWVRLWVEDNGIGVEPRHQQRIFRVFERLHAQEVYPGTGIGLAIVRRAVERMGGQVGIESAIGQESRLWIELLAPPQ